MDRLQEAIAKRDMAEVVQTIFERGSGGRPTIRLGYNREGELWDFKQGLPSTRNAHDPAWAHVAADLLAMHNNLGGVLFFGIADRNFEFVGTRDFVDAKLFNDKVRRYLGDKVWVEFSREYIQADQRYLGVASIQRRGLVPLRAQCDAPPDSSGKRLFEAGALCIRDGDSTRIMNGSDAEAYLASHRLPSSDARFHVNEPSARVLRPDWDEFVTRAELCDRVTAGLHDDRTYVTSLTGIGGIGKTALAVWAVLREYERHAFEYMISVSARDRTMTGGGIRPVVPSLASFDDLLTQTLEVLGFSELRSIPIEQKEAEVRSLLTDTSVLMFVDNLETVEDRRVVQFLETLPKPVKAITTSRVDIVRTAAFPISVGPMSQSEAIRFFELHARRHGKSGLLAMTTPEKQRIVDACSSVPLAIEWLVGHSKTPELARSLAEALASSGRRGAELLEFCFRRVHDNLSPNAAAVLASISLDDQPQVVEALGAAAELSIESVDDALADLEGCSLVEKVWDPRRRDFAYRCLPITRRFAHTNMQGTPGEEVRLRNRLSVWYEGRDITDPERRRVVKEMRSGARDPDAVMVDEAIALRRDRLFEKSEDYFLRAIERNPKSWRAHREYAELLRDRERIGDALREYEVAVQHAPRRGSDRALVFREYGMLLRQSGRPDGHEQAVAAFETSLRETPNDAVLQHALANSLVKLERFRRAEPILRALIDGGNAETRARSYPLLRVCLHRTNELVQSRELEARIASDHEARDAELGSKRTVEGSSKPITAESRGAHRHRRRRRR